MPAWLTQFAPILGLLVVVALVLSRLPPVEGVSHSKAFKIRRVMNWLPLGLTYAFLYMGRYNLKVSKFAFEEMQAAGAEPGVLDCGASALMGNDDFGLIFTVGVWVYGSMGVWVYHSRMLECHGSICHLQVCACGCICVGAWVYVCVYKYDVDIHTHTHTPILYTT